MCIRNGGKARKINMPYKDPEKKKANMRKWWAENTEHIREYCLENRERIASNHQQWRIKNKAKRAADMRAWRTIPANRIASNLRSRIANVLQGRTKFFKLTEVVGCSLEDLRAKIEALFLPGMSWGNYGAWEIDHKQPCAGFDLSDPAQQQECFHFSNLQPLWKITNRIKGDRYVV